MNSSTRKFTLTLGALACVAPSLALAHPGHDGDHGGLSWDFVAEVAHYLTSPYHLFPAVLLGAAVVIGWRHFRADRKGTKR